MCRRAARVRKRVRGSKGERKNHSRQLFKPRARGRVPLAKCCFCSKGPQAGKWRRVHAAGWPPHSLHKAHKVFYISAGQSEAPRGFKPAPMGTKRIPACAHARPAAGRRPRLLAGRRRRHGLACAQRRVATKSALPAGRPLPAGRFWWLLGCQGIGHPLHPRLASGWVMCSKQRPRPLPRVLGACARARMAVGVWGQCVVLKACKHEPHGSRAGRAV